MRQSRSLVKRCLRAATLGLAAAVSALSIEAATVSAVGTADLTRTCDFIFHGTVTDVRVDAGRQPGSIVTYVGYAVVDVLKGDVTRRRVVLEYLGGTLRERTLRIEGMKIPTVGEEGIYFVEMLSRSQIHPMYGWDQGRFLVQRDASGRKIVATHDGRPVGSVSNQTVAYGISTGVASGIALVESARDALSVDQFKARVRSLVEMQQ